MIKLTEVSKYYYGADGAVSTGLRNINLEFKLGEVVVITGTSGAGKTTLLNTICGVDSYDEGEIFVDGKGTSHFSNEEMDTYRRKRVAFIYQD